MGDQGAKKKGSWFFWLGLVFLVLILFLPTDKYLEVPGSASSIEEMVEIEGEGEDLSSDFYLLTVGIKRAQVFDFLLLPFRPYAEVMDEQEVVGDMDDESYDALQDYLMESSKQDAVEAAYRLAGKPVERSYQGIYVVSTLPESDFHGQLRPGDVVAAVNGESFDQSQAFMERIQSYALGDEVTLDVRRDGETFQAKGQVKAIGEDQKPAIGITLTQASQIQTNPEIEIDQGSIGGPSAGLMFALTIYAKLTDKDLGSGQEIAGTGTITAEGEVGSIGGMDKKLVAAEEAGVDILFVPADGPETETASKETNEQMAKRVAAEIDATLQVVPVRTLEEAITYLESSHDLTRGFLFGFFRRYFMTRPCFSVFIH